MNNVLIIAAHPDDEVIGCGGTILHHVNKGDNVRTIFLADGVGARGQKDFAEKLKERKQAANKVAEILKTEKPVFCDFPDNRMDKLELLDVVQTLEPFIKEFAPDIIYTHHFGDLNIDHRITFQAVLTACRPLSSNKIKAIYSFEVASSTEWAMPSASTVFIPNRFVNISNYMKYKIKALKAYSVEIPPFPHARSIEALEAFAKWRGASTGLEMAEAFHTVREILS